MGDKVEVLESQELREEMKESISKMFNYYKQGTMKIVGYSERGAMNALFYGIAQANDKKAFAEFLKIIGIDYNVSDVEFFMEFSLSEFGSPDLLVTFNANDQ